MFKNVFYGRGNIPDDIWGKAKNLPNYFIEAVRVEAIKRSVPPGYISVLQPCAVWAALDATTFHICFSNMNAGGLPRQVYEDLRGQGSFSQKQIMEAAIQNYGLVNPGIVSYDAKLIHASEEEQKTVSAIYAKNYIEDLIRMLTKPQAPSGFEYLQKWLNGFSSDYPEFNKNVFIAMRFRSAEHFTQIYDSIKVSLALYGLIAHRADDKIYPDDADLWNNVCVYMLGCKYGICVFEDIDEREFTPNIPLEYGFMRALNRRVLLLKEQRMPNMPSDITGKLYRPFDMMNISSSIRNQISQWSEKDLDLHLS